MGLTRREVVTRLLGGSAAYLFDASARHRIARHLSGIRSGAPEPKLSGTTALPTDSLKAIAASKGLLFGCAARSYWLSPDSPSEALIARECSVLVPEFELKWDYVEPEAARFDFHFGDQFVGFCAAHEIALRGHALVWHYSLPRWVNTETKTELSRTLRRHVERVVSHFAGHIYTWDVVNEPINVGDSAAGGLRRSVWWSALGPGYIETAFRTARLHDQNAKLAINENGLEYGDLAGRAKRVALLRLLEGLVRSGVPVTTLGIQGHLDGSRSPQEFSSLREFLGEVAALGLSIQLTELDVRETKLPQATGTRDALVAEQYHEFLSVALDETAVEAVLTWGISDANSWLRSYAPRPDKTPVRPLLWDAELHPKAAYAAVRNALAAAPLRTPKTG